MKRFRCFMLLVPILLSLGLAAQAQEIRVAAASDLKFALTEIAAEYEKQTGVKISATFGSSGNFFAQIQNGAPFDLFFSADKDYPQKLAAAGLVEPLPSSPYAIGRIVIWVPGNSALDPAKLQLKTLLDPSIQKIAIANPAHAPYGRAAVAALQKAGIYEQIKEKLVYGENISQAAQFVQSGNAQAGIIAMSLSVSPEMNSGKRWEIPQELYPELTQWTVVVKASANKEKAREFLAFFRKQRALMEKYGFVVPPGE